MKKNKRNYHLKDGRKVAGVTTILNELNKPFLPAWANRIGLQGIKMHEYVDDKSKIGSLCHDMILAQFKGEELDTSDYTKNQISQAENSMLSYLEWAKGKGIEPQIVEEEMVSEALEYGGTPDFYGMVDDFPTLLDFKTGSGLYPEHVYQVATYKHLLEERGHEVGKVILLNIPRSEDESFQVKSVSPEHCKYGFEIFKSCLKIRELKNLMKRGNGR